MPTNNILVTKELVKQTLEYSTNHKRKGSTLENGEEQAAKKGK